jgi:salicylate hydroxylase
MQERSVEPEGLIWRRWQDGREIAHTRLNPRLREWIGAPYYLTHRAHLHQVLEEAVTDLKIPVRLSSRIRNYDLEGPSIILDDGTQVNADLIVAVDGMCIYSSHKAL